MLTERDTYQDGYDAGFNDGYNEGRTDRLGFAPVRRRCWPWAHHWEPVWFFTPFRCCTRCGVIRKDKT